jgi:hypothetical protein
MPAGVLEAMIFHLFVVVFFNGFVLMLGILNVMRGLYALGVCERPQIPTDHASHISLHLFEVRTCQTERAMAEESLINMPSR